MEKIGAVMVMFGLMAPPHWEPVPKSSSAYPVACEQLVNRALASGVKRPDGSDPVCIVRVEEDEKH